MIEFFDVLANLLNLLGFIVLLDRGAIIDFIAYKKKEVDIFGKKPYYNYNAKWEFKYRNATGILLLIVGNIIQLFLSIVKLI